MGGKRIYKTKKTILKECKKKLKSKLKKKRKIKRKNKFGANVNSEYQKFETHIKEYIDGLTKSVNITDVRDIHYSHLRRVILTVVLPHPDPIIYEFGTPVPTLTQNQERERIEFIKICIIMALLNDEQTIKAIDMLKDNNDSSSPNGITGIRDILENTYGNTFSVKSLIDKHNHYRLDTNIRRIITSIQRLRSTFLRED